MSDRARPAQTVVEEHLTLADAAARTKIGKSTLRRDIKAGLIKRVVKLGHRTLLIPASSLNRYLEAHTI
jgi:excisionase family DNA binding protein